MVALKGSKITGFLSSPDPSIRGVLVYGPDAGLVSERSRHLGRKVVDDLDDPFNVSRLSEADVAADPGRMADEIGARSLMGGERLVFVEGAGTSSAAALEPLLDGLSKDVMLVVTAGDLKPSARLRKIFESGSGVAALPCYADNARSIDALIGEEMRAAGLEISGPARSYLASILGADRMVSLSEIRKLCLYCADRGKIELEDIETICADASASTFDEIVDAACEGRPDALETTYRRAIEAGVSETAILIVFMRHLVRIQNFVGMTDLGRSVDQAIRTARPPIHFRRQDTVKRQIRLWTDDLVRKAIRRSAETEAEMRLQADLSPIVVWRTLLAVAQQISRRRLRTA